MTYTLPAEYFRAALLQKLKDTGISQAKFADATGKPPSQVNDFIKGRTTGPEEWRQIASEYFGLRYEEMLAAGRQLLDGETPTAPDIPPDILEAVKDERVQKVVRALVEALKNHKDTP